MKRLMLVMTLIMFATGFVSLAWADPISDIQNGTIPVGSSATITGIVSYVDSGVAQNSNSYDFYIADASGAYNGICIYQGAYGVKIGDQITMTGEVDEYNGKTELKSLSSFSIQSRGNTPYAPVVISTADVSSTQYEGCLVTLESVQVSNEHIGSGKWEVQPTGGGTSATLDDALDYNYFPKNGDQFASITGIVARNTSSTPNQWLEPRFTADFSADDNLIPNYALHGAVVTMDDSRTVYASAYVVVEGDLIVDVTQSPPAVDIIEVNGVIYPGLISTHDHLSYDMWDFIPFTEAPNFDGRNEWAATQMYCDFKSQRNGFSSYLDEISKLAEVRMASSGCTVTQSQVSSKISHSDDNLAKLGVGIINGERYPGRCYDKVVGTAEDSVGWADYHNAAVAGRWHRFIVHLAETTDNGGDMMYQWNWWKSHEAFDGYDTIIHGVNIPAAEYALFDHGSDAWGDPLKTSLSWACKSNMLLYDETADISGALAQGVNVALAPDWTESGMPNMLAEMNYCRYVAFANGWSIQTQTMIEMVTCNAAFAFGQSDRLGSIEVGKVANFMVIADGEGDPYDDLMMVAGAGATDNYRCGPKDVKLTIVAGRPVYGDAALLNTTNFPFLNAGYIEDITICETAKKLTIARYDNGGYPGVDDLFNDFYNTLWSKYNVSSNYPCDFLSYDPDDSVPPTPAPTSTPPAGTYVIIASADDASNHNSYFTSNADYCYIGNRGGSSGAYTSGWRFENFNVPQGATINSAVLYMTQYPYSSKTTMGVSIYGDKSTNSAAFSTGDQPSDRPSTTATVAWTFPAPSYESLITLPDLSAVVEEIVGQGGWSSGGALTLLVKGDGTDADQRNRVYSYDSDPAKAAYLVIDYDAVTPTPTPEGYKTPSPSPTIPPTTTPSPTPDGYKTPSPSPTPEYTNLLPNPSFEDWSSSTSPDDWTPYSNVDVTQETSIVHGGTSSLRLELSTEAGSYGRGLYADATTEVGKTYTFQMWVYSDEPGSMGITANWYDGTTIYWDTETSTTSGEWELLTISSTAPAGTSNARCWVRGFKDNSFCGYADDGACYEGSAAPTPIPPTPTPVPPSETVVGDYNGDGTTDLAIFRPSLALWKIRNLTSIYFGASGDQPVPQDYDGDGTWDLAYFRPSSNLWKIKDLTRIYFGTSSDAQVPGDYDGDGTVEPAYFRPSTTLWNVRNQTRIYFGTSSDEPLNGDFNGDGTDDPTFFRASNGLWKVRNLTSVYFGTSEDTLVPADYNGDGTDDFAWYRPSSTLWKVKDLTRIYYATSGDTVFAGDFDGDGSADYGYFRPASILWKIKDITRVYFGQSADTQVSNPYPN